MNIVEIIFTNMYKKGQTFDCIGCLKLTNSIVSPAVPTPWSTNWGQNTNSNKLKFCFVLFFFRLKSKSKLKVVFDLSLARFVRYDYREKVIKKIKKIYGKNKTKKDPVRMKICNVNFKSNIMDKLIQESPLDVSTECFTKIYPKNQLVMITPDSPNILDYDPKDIYVISAGQSHHFMDTLETITAKKFGIRTARLPLVNHKELNLSQTYKILLKFNNITKKRSSKRSKDRSQVKNIK